MDPPEGQIASCSKCYLSHQCQHGWPCKHIVAASAELSFKEVAQWVCLTDEERMRRMFRSFHFVDTLNQAFTGIVVKRPLFSDLKRDDTIGPPPAVAPSKGGSLQRTRYKNHFETWSGVGGKRKRNPRSASGNYRSSHTVRPHGFVPKRMAPSSSVAGAEKASSTGADKRGDDITVDFPIDSDSDDYDLADDTTSAYVVDVIPSAERIVTECTDQVSDSDSDISVDDTTTELTPIQYVEDSDIDDEYCNSSLIDRDIVVGSW
jgi:hypothetical protein